MSKREAEHWLRARGVSKSRATAGASWAGARWWARPLRLWALAWVRCCG